MRNILIVGVLLLSGCAMTPRCFTNDGSYCDNGGVPYTCEGKTIDHTAIDGTQTIDCNNGDMINIDANGNRRLWTFEAQQAFKANMATIPHVDPTDNETYVGTVECQDGSCDIYSAQ